MKKIISALKLIGRSGKALKPLAKPAGAALTTIGAYYVLKTATLTVITSTGRYITDTLSTNATAVILIVSVIFMFGLSFLPKRVLLDKKISAMFLLLFCTIVVTTKPVAKKAKSLLNSKEFFYAKKFDKKEMNLKEIYSCMNVKTNAQKNNFLCNLIKQKKCQNSTLVEAIVEDIYGWGLRNTFNRKLITYHVILYGDIDLFSYLEGKEALDISSSTKYTYKSVFGDKELTALDLAQDLGKFAIAKRINILLTFENAKNMANGSVGV